MKWQEYQEAVGQLYEQMEGFEAVRKNITIPDKITGQARQIDVWIEFEAKSHKIGMLVDAKFHKSELDVKDIEEVEALAKAVGANKAIIVAANGWNESASKKAEFIGMDLRIITMEQALDILIPDKWSMCPICQEDCIVMEMTGGVIVNDTMSLVVAGRCRECRTAQVWCWACGSKFILESKDTYQCGCESKWKFTNEILKVKTFSSKKFITVLESIDIPNFKKSGQVNKSENFEALLDKIALFRDQGAFSKSLSYIEKAEKLFPNSTELVLEKALTLDASGAYYKALTFYDHAIELDNSLAYAYFSRGILFLTLKDWEHCIGDLQKYLSFNSPMSLSDLYMVEKSIEYAQSQLHSDSQGSNSSES